MIVFTEVDQTTAENKFWYRFRPQETINELNDVMKVVRKDLGRCTTSYWHLLKGISPLHDPYSSSSAVLIYKGLKQVQERILMCN
jgi:carboxylesterase